MEQSVLNLKQFSDYRAFLLAHVQDCKKRKSDWTYGIFARQLGLKDPSSITKIIQGQREPGPTITGKLIQYFQFSAKDAQYFQDLIRLRKIKNDPGLTMMLLEKVGRQNTSPANEPILDEKVFKLISNWYCFAIREMTRLDYFMEDPNWISKVMEFKVTPTEAERALSLLLELGLLERVNGKLKVKDTKIHTFKDDVVLEAGKRYHESMLDLAKIAIRKFGVHEREFTGSTLTIKKDKIPEAKILIREFRTEFAKLMESNDGDLTTHLQIQFFPLTKQKAES